MCDVCGNRPAWLDEPIVESFAKKKKKKLVPPAATPPSKAARSAPARETPQSGTGASACQPAAPARAAAAPTAPAEPPADRALLDFLKQWRLRAAQRAAVPAYIVLSDASLEDLCRKRPSNLRELLRVFGFGERKAEMYGSEIFAALEAFRNGARAERQERQASPAEETIALLAEGKSLEEIARIRGRRLSTVVEVVVDLVTEGRIEYRIDWVGEERHNAIAEAARRLGTDRLKTLKDVLPADVTYEELRLVVAWVKREGAQQ
jgi:ATP-dependent DNA helicase RecQ